MPDREKVIKGLECHQDPHGCQECPYLAHETPLKDCDDDKLIADAIALLKEQEPVAPFHICIHGEKLRTLITNNFFIFCPYCGRRIKWDG